jgi:hypothetical protein
MPGTYLTKSLTLVFCFAILLSGCDTKQKLDKMSDTTEKMGQSTENLEKTSDQISTRTDDLYVGMREAEAIKIQTESMKHVVGDAGVVSKIHYAIEYFGAAEFQHWYPSASEGTAKREELYLKAVELFFSEIDDLVADDFPVSGGSWPFSYMPSNEWIALSALSTGMSKIHPKQLALAEKYHFKAVSFYEILQSGLRAKRDYLAGKTIPEYQRKVLENERTLIYLLQLRHNFFKALVLGRLTNFEENFFDKAWMVAFGWSAELDRMPEAETRMMNEWMWKALETQNFLREIGEEVVHNDPFNYLFSRGELHLKKPVLRNALALFNRVGELTSLENVQAQPGVGMFLDLLPKTLENPGPKVSVDSPN